MLSSMTHIYSICVGQIKQCRCKCWHVVFMSTVRNKCRKGDMQTTFSLKPLLAANICVEQGRGEDEEENGLYFYITARAILMKSETSHCFKFVHYLFKFLSSEKDAGSDYAPPEINAATLTSSVLFAKSEDSDKSAVLCFYS